MPSSVGQASCLSSLPRTRPRETRDRLDRGSESGVTALVDGNLSSKQHWTPIRGPGNGGQGRPPLPNRRYRRPCRCWIPAYAGMTTGGTAIPLRFLRFRRNDNPHPARLNDYTGRRPYLALRDLQCYPFVNPFFSRGVLVAHRRWPISCQKLTGQ
jgi:hypothetical protein